MSAQLLNTINRRERELIGRQIMEQADYPVLFPLEDIGRELGISHQAVDRILCLAFWKMAHRARNFASGKYGVE